MIKHINPTKLHSDTKQKILAAHTEIAEHRKQIAALVGYVKANEEVLEMLQGGKKNVP